MPLAFLALLSYCTRFAYKGWAKSLQTLVMKFCAITLKRIDRFSSFLMFCKANGKYFQMCQSNSKYFKM